MRSTARVLIVGAGGLGCPAAMALARAGVGTIAIADDDEVDLSNLHRQILYGEPSVGKRKVSEAASALERLAPGVQILPMETRLLPENARDLARGFDIVVEGADNFATKFLAADACWLEHVPIVQGAAVRWNGTALASSRDGRPCYRCLFEDIPEGAQQGCSEAGVMGPMVGVVGAIMADLALSLLDGKDVAGTLVTYDGKADRLRRSRLQARPGCALCGEKTIAEIELSRYVRDPWRPSSASPHPSER